MRPVDRLPEPKRRDASKPLALEGLRVIDFTRFLAGPWCTQTLADLGAEVIKVESPGGGDGTRAFTPPEIGGESPYFLGLNRNKKSIAIDMRTASGKEIVRDLVKASDVVVENFLPGAMERLELGYEELKILNPGLIYCAVNGYGASSSLADQPGFDSVFQAESGFASLTGDPDRMPMRTGTPIIDITASMNATIAILAALAARERHGMGQRAEVTLFDTAVGLLAYHGMNYLASGKDPFRQGNTAPVSTPIGMFATKDDRAVYISCGTQKSWEDLAIRMLERPDLAQHPRFAHHRDRNANQAELMALLEQIFKERERDHWVERARAAGVPLGAVRSVGEAFFSPFAAERGIATKLHHPDGDVVPNVSAPFFFSETPVVDPIAAPRLDADRPAVLRDVLGYADSRIKDMEQQGAFGASSQQQAKS
ncbi:CaiB/BaiF CoA transferase family protein [Tianweitania sediminis]|uniref:CoA transferase n=1 Tax=Tianweitania sediminis TaxID=1502156 RepID=A0A8J7UKH1_9HYPH|nr:CoA transferase [Tianweitania sediminis]MBP0441168.1 CoA transferase [Tianweitania sediminis]